MKAFELLSDPRRFKSGTCYSDSKGNPCLPADGPVSFDALGALFWSYPNGEHGEPCRRARERAKELYGVSLGKLQHDEALGLLRELDV